MYNDNHNDIYDNNNNNIRNKNQLDLSLSNVNWWLEWLKKEKKKKQLLTLGRLHLYWMC